MHTQKKWVLTAKLKVSSKKKLVLARYHLGSCSNTYGEVSDTDLTAESA